MASLHLSDVTPFTRHSIQTRRQTISNQTFPQFILHYVSQFDGHSAQKRIFPQKSASRDQPLNAAPSQEARKRPNCCVFTTE